MKTRLLRTCLTVAILMLSGAAYGVEYFVEPGGSDAASGTNWATAFLTIANAVGQGDTTIVTVSNGTYNITAEIVVPPAITVRSFGGGVYGGLANASNTVVSMNGSGRVFQLNDSTIVLDGFTITGGYGNYSMGFGVNAPWGSTIRNCIVRDNIAGAGTGCIAIYGGVVSNCVVRNNYTGNRGGPPGIFASNSVITHCQILSNTNSGGGDNWTPGEGCGIYAAGTSEIRDCRIVGNVGISGHDNPFGGGAYLANSSVIRNSLIASNRIENSGGGVFGGTVENCTVVGNSSSGSTAHGGGVFGSAVTNSIVVDNTTGSGDSSVWNYDTSSAFDYSCSVPKPSGTGNIDSVSFVDAGAGDYQLLACAAVNSGTNLAWMTGALDLAGTNRILGGRVDMGCYERVPSDFECYLVADLTTVLTPADVVFTASVSGTNTNITAYVWDFGDGQTDSGATLGVVTNSYSAPGLYTVTLTVTNSSSQTAYATNVDYVAAWGTNAYVCQSCPSPSVPYHTWSNAATAIPDAVSPAPAGVAVVLSNDTYSISGQIFIRKAITLTSFGGGVYGGMVNASNTVIDRGGGGAYQNDKSRVLNCVDGGVVLDGLTLMGAGYVYASYDGGGVYMPSGGTVQNCIIQSNIANNGYTKGAGIYIVGGTVSNCIVKENKTSARGGGTGIWATNSLIVGCNIHNNTNGASGANQQGWLGAAGIFAYDTQVLNCRITDNEAWSYSHGSQPSGGHGGGILADGDTLIRNCLITGNSQNYSGYHGGGVYGGRIVNCTIVDNHASSSTSEGGGVHGSAVTNSIVLDNTTGLGDTTRWNYDPASTFAYSCSVPKPAGTGNIDAALFVDPGSGNYQLQAGPPVNSGTNLPWMAGALDLAGTNRILSGRVDMGCYERVPSLTLECSFVADSTTVSAPADVVFTATVGGTNTNITVYAWDFGDGQTDSGATLGVVTNTYTDPGLYTVMLLVSNDAGESAWATNVDYIAVWGTNAYVWTNSPSPSVPYHTWSNAAHAITDAIVPAPVGTTIVLSNDTYRTSAELILNRALTITSFGGGVYGGMSNAANTIIDRGGGGAYQNDKSRVIKCPVDGSVLDGLTIKGAGYVYAGYDGGGVYMPNGGTIQSCIIWSNIANGGSSSGAGIWIADGIVSNCIVKENYTGNRGGPTGIWASNSVLTHCQILSNTNHGGGDNYAFEGCGVYAEDSLVRNCLMAGNVGENDHDNPRGGGIYLLNSTLESCTVADNHNEISAGGVHAAGNSTIVNSIIYHNTASGSPDNLNTTNGVTYSCSVDEGNDVDGNSTIEPTFRDMTNGNYRLSLKHHFPAYDLGLIQGWMIGGTDLDGTPRIVGPGVNMGCYEGRTTSLGAVIVLK